MVGDALGLVWIIWFGSSDRKCLLGAIIRGRGPVPTGVTMRLNVRYGSLADITEHSRHVRFTPKSGHWAARPSPHLAVARALKAANAKAPFLFGGVPPNRAQVV